MHEFAITYNSHVRCIYDPNQCINLFILWNNALVLIVKNDFFKKVGSIKWKEKYDRGRRIPSTYKYINQDYFLSQPNLRKRTITWFGAFN